MANNAFSKIKKSPLKTVNELKKEEQILNITTNEIEIDKLINYSDSDGLTNDDIFGPVTEESVLNLANGIKESGFKTAVEVWDMKNGTYMIYSGHRRVAAAKYLKYESVKCDVYDYPEEESERRLQFLRANIHSRGAIKAASEGGDIYIAKQIKYLESILRSQGIRSQGEIDKLVCNEFNAKKNTVWKYKSLLKACDELIEAESKGYILIEQAASLCVFSKEDQKIIVDAIMEYVSKGTKFLGKDLDVLIKKIHESEDLHKEDVENSISSYGISSIIADILRSKVQDEKDEEQENTFKPTPAVPESSDNQTTTVYGKYSLKLSSFKKDLDHNRIDELKPAEVKSLIEEYESIKASLDTAFLFSELMAGMYHGSTVFSNTKIAEDELLKFNAAQLRKLEKAYEQAKLDDIVSQFSTAEAELVMREKNL